MKYIVTLPTSCLSQCAYSSDVRRTIFAINSTQESYSRCEYSQSDASIPRIVAGYPFFRKMLLGSAALLLIPTEMLLKLVLFSLSQSNGNTKIKVTMPRNVFIYRWNKKKRESRFITFCMDDILFLLDLFPIFFMSLYVFIFLHLLHFTLYSQQFYK